MMSSGTVENSSIFSLRLPSRVASARSSSNLSASLRIALRSQFTFTITVAVLLNDAVCTVT